MISPTKLQASSYVPYWKTLPLGLIAGTLLMQLFTLLFTVVIYVLYSRYDNQVGIQGLPLIFIYLPIVALPIGVISGLALGACWRYKAGWLVVLGCSATVISGMAFDKVTHSPNDTSSFYLLAGSLAGCLIFAVAFSLFVLNRIFYRLNRTRSRKSDLVSSAVRSTKSEQPTALHNFGRNVSFCPEFQEHPRSEAELLEVLQRHVGRRIRAHGSLHSWSRVPVATDVAINLNQMNGVRLNLDLVEPTATVQAGCQIKQLVFELNKSGWTTPTLGLIMEQTIAGATATATHGSGRHCLSHYIRSMRLATYDAQGNPVIRDIAEGEELQAACCSLGAMGIVTEVVIPIRRQYSIEEHFRDYPDLDAVLDAEAEYPLQQFFLIPWKWAFLAQHRREAKDERSWHAPLYRAYWTWGMDHGLHWIIIALARWLPDFACPLAFRAVLPFFVPRRWHVVDRSDRQLTMQHQLYRHIETELFVTKSRLAEMLDLSRWVLQYSAGEVATVRDIWTDAITDCGIATQFKQLKGSYRHHYPICIRKVQADQGLITMSGSAEDEPWYAISFISYVHPDQRAGFFQFAEFITLLSAHLFSCRPHWGKYHQLSPDTLRKLYPQYNKFQEIRDRLDPTNAFLPAWMRDGSAELS